MKFSDMLQGPFPLCDIPIFVKQIVSLTKCCAKFSPFEFVHHEAGKSDPSIFNVTSYALLLQAVLTIKHN